MSDFEFGGSLYPTASAMHLAIAHNWLTAGGANRVGDVLCSFNERRDIELADECISDCELSEYEEVEEYVDLPGGGVDVRMVEKPSDFSRNLLIRAFEELRANYHNVSAEVQGRTINGLPVDFACIVEENGYYQAVIGDTRGQEFVSGSNLHNYDGERRELDSMLDPVDGDD